MGEPSTIVVVEDDANIAALVELYLREEGFRVTVTDRGERALDLIRARPPTLVVLDVGLAGELDGFDVCRSLRAHSDLPVLMLTARDDEADRIGGFDAGADDYLVKPFALEELLARLRALLRRNEPEVDDPVLVVADLRLDPQRRRCERGEREIELTKTEFDLLQLLMEHPGIVLTRDRIYERIWGYEFETSSKSLDVYVGYLRRKTEEAGEPRLIHTVRGVGYTVRAP